MNQSGTDITRESTQLPFWSLPAENVAGVFHVLIERGLRDADVAARRKMFGFNRLGEERKLEVFTILADQFKSPLILILIGAGVITAFLQEWANTVVIFAAVFVNASLGFYQEYKAESVISELKSYIRTRVRVRRNGGDAEVDAEELVPGDVVHVAHGSRIPADARILYANNFEVDESILTGESLPQTKDVTPVRQEVPLSDRTSMLYGGTLVVGGVAEAIIVATGELTEFGNIARLVQAEERVETPLQKSIRDFAVSIGVILSVLVTALFFIGLGAGYDIFDMFLISVAVAVSAVPEGLPIALTVILAMGVQRLAHRKGVVRRLLAAETLGATSIILTDKTGTLTEARMELLDVMRFSSSESEKDILRHALETLDIVIENPNEAIPEWRVIGHPIEQGLVKGAAKRGVLHHYLRGDVQIIDRLPFSSQHKFSGVISLFNKDHHISVLGAPEILLAFSDVSDADRAAILESIQKKAAEGMRVVGVAWKKLSSEVKTISRERSFSGLHFGGLLIFHDPIRGSVKDAIARISHAGIQTVIVTGDHRGTAETVARELGILTNERVMTGEEIRGLSDDELARIIGGVRVFARVLPEDKLRLVKILKAQHEIVAVTGDGINDAPALKEADIGVSLGSGTDVAKGAADLILLDDNFSTLVIAVEEGRRILQNIRKVLIYLLSNSFNELFLISGALLLGLPLPINALQILFVNFFSDSFPALAFAFENGADDHLDRHMRGRPKIFDREMRAYILGIGIFSSLLLFGAYVALLRYGFPADLVRTGIFATFASYTLFSVFALRSLKQSILKYNPFANRFLTAGAGVGFVFILGALYMPVFQNFFGTVALPLPWLLAVIGAGFLNISMIELVKFLYRRYR